MIKYFLNIFLLCILISQGHAQDNIFWEGTPPDLEDIYDFSTIDFLRSLGEESTDGITLNTLGFEAYKQNDLLLAAKLWRCSILKNDNYHWSHYNYACVLALFAESLGINPAKEEYSYQLVPVGRDYDLIYSYTEKIFYHLKKAITLNPSIFNKMQEDSDLNIIRDMDEYKFMLFYPENDIVKILNSIEKWHGSDTGVWPDGGYAYIKENEITITVVYVDDHIAGQTEISSFDKTGTFSIDGNKIIVYIDSPEREILEGEISVGVDEFGFFVYVSLFIDGRYYSNHDPNIGGA